MRATEPVYDLGEVSSRGRSTLPPERAAGIAGPAPVSNTVGSRATPPVPRQRTSATRSVSSRPFPAPAHAQPAAGSRRDGSTAAGRVARRDWRPATAGTLSLLVPGLGQVARSDLAVGLLFASLMALSASITWAIHATLAALVRTLPLLEVAPQATFWSVEALFFACAALHAAAVYDALRPGRGEAWTAHPALAAAASIVLPGWGQVLRGRAVRAAAFVAGLWLIAGAWLVTSAPAVAMLDALGLQLPFGLAFAVSPPGRWAAFTILWVLSVYDAATTTAGRPLPAGWSREARGLLRS